MLVADCLRCRRLIEDRALGRRGGCLTAAAAACGAFVCAADVAGVTASVAGVAVCPGKDAAAGAIENTSCASACPSLISRVRSIHPSRSEREMTNVI